MQAGKNNQLVCGRMPQITPTVLPTVNSKRCLSISVEDCLKLVKYEPNNLEDAHGLSKKTKTKTNLDTIVHWNLLKGIFYLTKIL